MSTRDINLTEHYDRFVEDQIKAGRYKNASEVVRASLRLLEQQIQAEELKLKMLQKLSTNGFRELDQGQGLAIANQNDLRSAIAKIDCWAAEPIKQRQAE